jgi:predicted dehydrogenase
MIVGPSHENKTMSVNLGIIGTGAIIGRAHWPVLQKMPELFRVVALANRTRAKAEPFAAEVGARIYEDYRRLLDDPEVEAVFTAVPIESNARVLIDSIHAGKHVLAEKPLAATAAEGREVVLAARQTNKAIAIAENFRYRGDILKARELIAAGEIGEVYSFQVATRFDLNTEFRRPWFSKGTWRQNPAHLGLSMIFDMGVHVACGIRDMLGEVSEIYAQLLDTGPVVEGPDTLVAQLTMRNNAVGQYLGCYSAKVVKETVFDFIAFGKTGSLQVSEGEVTWLRAPGTAPLTYRPESYDRGYKNQWRNFYNAIRGEEPVASTVEQGYRDLLVIDAAVCSAREQRRVPVELDRGLQ